METPSSRLNALSLAGNVPVSVTLELTRRCPLSCRHCYLPETRGRARPGRELGTAAWRKIISDIAGAGGLYLVFTGGEPLLRPDLPELCRHAAASGFNVRVFSTGLGLDAALAAALASAGVSAFEISFYGRPVAHDRVTGRAGSFKASLGSARLLKGCGIQVRMKMPLMRDTLRDAAWLRALARKEGFSISFDPVIAPANDGGNAAAALRLSARGLAAAMRLAPRRRKAPQALPPSAGLDLICGAGRNVCSVSPDGALSPCLQLPVRLGNIARRSFPEVWNNSPWLKNWRRVSSVSLAGCAGCKDSPYCSRCPGISLLETGDISAPNAQACALAAAQRRAAGLD